MRALPRASMARGQAVVLKLINDWALDLYTSVDVDLSKRIY